VKVHTATLAGGSSNADRVFVTDHAVILLDGASAFAPVDVDPGDYAETLGAHIADELDSAPIADLSTVVAQAISATVRGLRLYPGRPAPSSTVAILRTRRRLADLYVLGDSPIHYGTEQTHHVLVDDRIADLHLPEREYYCARLAAGEGFTSRHRALLSGLQNAQHVYRNQPSGYWIAETNTAAAHHGYTVTIPASRISWAVLATDGASDIIDHRAQPAWADIARLDRENLDKLLYELHRWETIADPNGKTLPRAKRHDDKTVAAIAELVLDR
jgi:hypothetical protein